MRAFVVVLWLIVGLRSFIYDHYFVLVLLLFNSQMIDCRITLLPIYVDGTSVLSMHLCGKIMRIDGPKVHIMIKTIIK